MPAKIKSPHNYRREAYEALRIVPADRKRFLELAHSPEFVDRPPTQIYYTLLDRAVYLCSVRSMYRILAAEHELKDRRNLREKTIYERPELLATGPKQLWSWDITKLRGPAKGIYYQLYVVLDVFSRYVVGWLLAARESTELAIHLLSTSHENQGVVPGTLTVHADRGSSMMSTGVASLLERLDVSKSHSRPSISDDNPYSESQFKTMKYRPEYPDRFGSFEDALQFCRGFFKWYHEEHYHSGLCWLTPATVHYGGGPAVLAARHQTLMKAYEHNPRLFINGAPKMAVLPARVWINAPFHEKSISEEQESSSTQEVTSDYTESHSQV